MSPLPSVPFPLSRIPPPLACAPLLSSVFPSRLLFLFCYAHDLLINLTHSTHPPRALPRPWHALQLFCFGPHEDGRGSRSVYHGRGVSQAGGVEGPGELFSLFFFFLFLSLLFLSVDILSGMFPNSLSLIFREGFDWALIPRLESALFDIGSVR
jgi:hypothetical protein